MDVLFSLALVVLTVALIAISVTVKRLHEEIDELKDKFEFHKKIHKYVILEPKIKELLQRKITRPRFSFPMTEEQSTDFLMASYMAEVEYRHRMFIDDEHTRDNIRRLAKFLTSDNSKFGIMFCGICGNGKTTLLYALRSAINMINDCGGFEDRKTGMSIIDAKDIAHYAKDYRSFQELKMRPMIAIEDMGREATEVLDYGNVLNPVIDLIEYRYDNQLFTAITTNLTSKQVSEKYGKRIADRFNEMLEVIVFENAAYRK